MYQQVRWKGFNPRKAIQKEEKKKVKEEAVQARINENILEKFTFETVTVIGPTGTVVQNVNPKTALAEAREQGLDLVLIKQDPPTCKIMNSADFIEKHLHSKPIIKEKMKEVVITENISDWDFQRKVENVKRFLCKFHRVKVTVSFKRDLNEKFGRAALNNILQRITGYAGITQVAVSPGKREVFVLINPDIKSIQKLHMEATGQTTQPTEEQDQEQEQEKQKEETQPDQKQKKQKKQKQQKQPPPPQLPLPLLDEIDEDIDLVDLSEEAEELAKGERIDRIQMKKMQQMAMREAKKEAIIEMREERAGGGVEEIENIEGLDDGIGEEVEEEHDHDSPVRP